MLGRLALLLAAACLLAGCGEEAAGNGSAQLWITQDRGREVKLTTTVPAGISALEALRRKADVETRYGGRFVQAIDGVEGDLGGQHDWFFFVNGYEADLSAADYELHDGDVLWWDHRSWEDELREPVVVGAFPEPFLHGYDGDVRPVAVRYEPGRAEGAKSIARLLGADSVAPVSVPPPKDANVFYTVSGRQRFEASLREESGPAGAPVRFVFAGDAAALARQPRKFRFRY
ncbi:MAG TPA: DUF4430 domain-containing protein, partial [Gaiellaceae bacterium]|nr:DUF4430 domain-containing protein [Gaiellaceae bacterium]